MGRDRHFHPPEWSDPAEGLSVSSGVERLKDRFRVGATAFLLPLGPASNGRPWRRIDPPSRGVRGVAVGWEGSPCRRHLPTASIAGDLSFLYQYTVYYDSEVSDVTTSSVAAPAGPRPLVVGFPDPFCVDAHRIPTGRGPWAEARQRGLVMSCCRWWVAQRLLWDGSIRVRHEPRRWKRIPQHDFE